MNWRADAPTTYNRWDRSYPSPDQQIGRQDRSRAPQSDAFDPSGAGMYGFIDPGLLVDWALQAPTRSRWNTPASYSTASHAPSNPGQRHSSSLPSNSFQNTQSVGTSFATGQGRLDTQAKVESYIRDRTADPSFKPTAENLDLLAKEVAQQGGIIAIATHMGGSKQSDDAIILENGATIDLIRDVGSSNAAWQWLHHGKDFGSTYDPGRNVVDPATGQFKTWGEFISSKGKPVPPYIPLPPGYGNNGGIDHVDAEWLMRRPQGQLYTDMPGLPASMLNDKTQSGPMLTLGRWVQDQQMPATKESLETFVKMHPDFEMRGDNQIRIKPEAMHKYPNDPSAGEWRTVIKDNGKGAAWDFTQPAANGRRRFAEDRPGAL